MDMKRHRKYRRRKSLFGFWLIVFCMAVFLLGTFLMFRTRNIDVVGTTHVDDAVILEWVEKSPLSMNTLYILFRQSHLEKDLPPGIASLQVELTSFRDLKIRVAEERMIGYVLHDNKKVYFDRNGIPSLITDEEIEGTLEIKGFDLNVEELTPGMALPMEKKQMMYNLRDVILFAENLELTPDYILVEGEDITLRFGVVRASLGNRNFWDRMIQIPPILEQLSVRYPGKSGVVQLERFLSSGNFIHFVPDEPI